METKLAIAYLILSTVVTCVCIISSSVSKRLVKNYKEYFDHTNRFNDALFEYCIADILNRSIQREDYEMAGKCMELLESIKKRKTNH